MKKPSILSIDVVKMAERDNPMAEEPSEDLPDPRTAAMEEFIAAVHDKRPEDAADALDAFNMANAMIDAGCTEGGCGIPTCPVCGDDSNEGEDY